MDLREEVARTIVLGRSRLPCPDALSSFASMPAVNLVAYCSCARIVVAIEDSLLP